MSDYKFKSIVAKKDRISTIEETVYVPDEVVRQIKSEVIDSINDNIYEIYKCQFYCMEDMCEHDIQLPMLFWCTRGILKPICYVPFSPTYPN